MTALLLLLSLGAEPPPATLRAWLCTREVPEQGPATVSVRNHGRGHAEVEFVGPRPPPRSLVEATLERPAAGGPMRARDVKVLEAGGCKGMGADERLATFQWPEGRLLAEGVVVGESPGEDKWHGRSTLLTVEDTIGTQHLIWVNADAAFDGPKDPSRAVGGFLSYEIRAFGTCYPPYDASSTELCLAHHVERVGVPLHAALLTRPSAEGFDVQPWSDAHHPAPKRLRVLLDASTRVLGTPPAERDARLSTAMGVTVFGESVPGGFHARLIEINWHVTASPDSGT